MFHLPITSLYDYAAARALVPEQAPVATLRATSDRAEEHVKCQRVVVARGQHV